MEILIRLLRWMLSYAYPAKRRSGVYGEGAAQEAAIRQYDDAREEKRKASVVEQFTSTAEKVQGAVDYGELSWNTYTHVVETAEQFTFYSGRNIAKVIAKKEFADARQLAALRRVIRRNVTECELRED